MVRLSISETERRDQLESAQFTLGSALVLLNLIDIRVQQAAKRQPDLMDPAVSALDEVRHLIRQGQTQIGAVVPVATRARSNR